MQYVHTDALGSPVAHTNGSGTLLNRARFEPYGYVAAGTKPSADTSLIGFTGHVQDAETDLVYMQQRYYDPVVGRFLSVDPIVTDANTGKSFGIYTYVDSNPYAKVDPDGRDPDFANWAKPSGMTDNEYATANHQASGNAIVGAAVLVIPIAAVESGAVAAISGAVALRAWKAVSVEQKQLINQFFKGSKVAAGKVTKETLEKYKKVAQRQINRGKDNNGEQEKRIKEIDKKLKGD